MMQQTGINIKNNAHTHITPTPPHTRHALARQNDAQPQHCLVARTRGTALSQEHVALPRRKNNALPRRKNNALPRHKNNAA